MFCGGYMRREGTASLPVHFALKKSYTNLAESGFEDYRTNTGAA